MALHRWRSILLRPYGVVAQMALMLALVLAGVWLEERWLMRIKDEGGGWHLSPNGEYRAMANYRRERIFRQGKDVRLVVQAKRHSQTWYDLAEYEVDLPFFENWQAYLQVEWKTADTLRVGYYRMIDIAIPLELQRYYHFEIRLL